MVRGGLSRGGGGEDVQAPMDTCSLMPEKTEGDSPSCCEVGVTDRLWCVDLGERVGFSAAGRSNFLIKVYGVGRLSPRGHHGTREQGPAGMWSNFPLLCHVDPPPPQLPPTAR